MVNMLHALWVIIVGAVIGAVASMIINRDMPWGWIGNIVGGLIGAWLGESIFGAWGPNIAGMAIVPAIIGAVIVVLLTTWIFSSINKRA
ncbi:GlsB/YeaQ/YmgE family stress response membrane protein [Companilactobacillus alimentarius]